MTSVPVVRWTDCQTALPCNLEKKKKTRMKAFALMALINAFLLTPLIVLLHATAAVGMIRFSLKCISLCSFRSRYKLPQILLQTGSSVLFSFIFFLFFTIPFLVNSFLVFQSLKNMAKLSVAVDTMVFSVLQTSSKTNSPTWTSPFLRNVSLIKCPSVRLPVWKLHHVFHSTWTPFRTLPINCIVNFSQRTSTTTQMNLFSAIFLTTSASR